MRITALNNRILQFYVATSILFIALGSVGYFMADKWEAISKNPFSAASYFRSPEAASVLTFVDLPRMTVSLGNSAISQMSVNISLEVESRDMMVLEGYMPQILDKFNLFLPRVNIEEISKPPGLFMLRKNMLWQVNNLGMPIRVHDLLLQNLIIM
ncbi:MAG: flagellar basal body-associated FliL family protein [Bdellovibrionales bacterium]